MLVDGTAFDVVPFVDRSIAAVRYEIEVLDAAARIVVQSSLVANEPIQERPRDPRAAAALRSWASNASHGELEVTLGSRLELSVDEYLGWYNAVRPHESLGDIPPAEYEQLRALQEATTLAGASVWPNKPGPVETGPAHPPRRVPPTTLRKKVRRPRQLRQGR